MALIQVIIDNKKKNKFQKKVLSEKIETNKEVNMSTKVNEFIDQYLRK